MRHKLRDLWDVYESIYVLINATTIDIRDGFIQSRANIADIDAGLLENLIVELGKKLDDLKQRYGVIAQDEVIVTIGNMVKHSGEGRLALMPKYIIEQLFTNYQAALKKFNMLSPHVRIGIDPGIYRATQGTAELYLTEAALFEDLCSLNNLILDLGPSNEKVDVKRHDALIRSLIEACFRYLEAFLNGLAFDFNVREYDKISGKDRVVLTEWNNENKRTKYISFRDKILKYPKIIGGFSEPPILESNCPSLKYLMDKSKIFRDAIVHASPFLEPWDVAPEKERAFYSVSINDATKTLEATLDLTEVIQKTLGRPLEELWWFCKLDCDDRFPNKVFD